MYSLPAPAGRHGRAIAVTGRPAEHSALTPVTSTGRRRSSRRQLGGAVVVATVVVVAAVVAVVEAVVGGSGTAGQDGIRPMLASVLTEATNVPGAVGSGRASHGSSAATRTRNSAGAPVIVAVKSNRQFHCPPPPTCPPSGWPGSCPRRSPRSPRRRG